MIARLILAAVLLGAGIARAEPAQAIALLPLDADKGLEIYGQPVAGAIAKALEDGKLEVIVVGAKMPDNVVLIVDGRIAKGAGGSVILSARVRVNGARDGVEVKPVTASTLTKIDAAAAELSARVVPVVREQLAALPPPPDHGRVINEPPHPLPAPKAPVMVVGVADWTKNPAADPLKPALDTGVAEWLHAQHRELQPIDASKLDPKLAAKAVAGANAELGVGLWILGYHTDTVGKLPVASARVRVRIADGRDVLFDRVVVTDTVLGDPKLSPAELAARVAREVLAILRPHMRRAVRSWH